ncbi:SCAN domain-containing protein 3 [Trichonephila clavipes]|nr:SCAN domain-containing protein 3 [Trichonephila clavipes]
MAQRKHLDDFLRGRIIGRLECGRTQLEVSEELGITRSVISRLWFSLQSDSRRTLIWRTPGTHYHQEKTIERHRYDGAGWLVWGGIILGSRTDLHVQSVTTKLTPNIVESKKKCRQYSVDYLKFGFIESVSDKRLPMFILCNRVLSNDARRTSKLEDPLRRCHPDKRSKDLKFFQILKEKLQKHPTKDRMFASTSKRDDNGLQVSYNISLLIAKSGKSHTIGE